MKKFSILILLILCVSNWSFAFDNNEVYQKKSEEYRKKIKTIINQDIFGKTTTESKWELKPINEKEKDNDDEIPEWLERLGKWLGNDSSDRQINFANFIEFILWITAICLILYIIYKYKRQIRNILNNFRGTTQNEKIMVESLFGIEIQDTKLPDNIIDTAQGYWQNGEPRHGLSILLQASLIKLIQEHDCQFTNSDTEQEVCNKVEQQLASPISQYIHDLVIVWQKMAYAHQKPTDNKFQILCERWRELFT